MKDKKSLRERLSALGILILDLLFPPKCIICNDVLTDKIEMCPDCLKLWESARRIKCPVCSKAATGCRCRSFHMTDTDMIGERSISALAFYKRFGSEDLRDIVIRRLVYAVKTDEDRSSVKFCARELSRHILKSILIAGEKPEEYRITYPPRSRKRIKKYGFDHGRDLARMLSRYTGIPMEETLINCGRRAQKSLNALERKENAIASYKLKKDASPSGKYIIIDDVITTGATVNACARILKSAGAESVYPVCIARSKKKKIKLRRTTTKPWFKSK